MIEQARSKNFRKAQERLQALIDAELEEPTDQANPDTSPTRLQAIIRHVAECAAGKATVGKAQMAAVELLFQRWAGKPIVVLEERVEAEQMQVVFNAPRPNRGSVRDTQ